LSNHSRLTLYFFGNGKNQSTLVFFEELSTTMSDLTTTYAQGFVEVSFDEALYPKESIYGAAYIFIDRCYMHLDRPSDGRISVKLKPKQADGASLEVLVGEFENELLGQAWRRMITEENRQMMELVTTRALAGAAGPPGLDDLLQMDDEGDAFEDPLGIAMSWEDKYKKKKPEDDGNGGEPTTSEAQASPAEGGQE
jgi:His-Xaa-Ser system protein HxsD